MNTQQGHHTASLNGLAFLPCLDLRAVGLGMSKAVSQIWRRKRAEEEKASEEKERRRRGWQGTNVTTPRAHGNQKGQPCPCPDTGDRGRDWPLSETLQPATQSNKNTSTPQTGSERMPDRQRDQGRFHFGDQPSSWPVPPLGHQGGLQPAATSDTQSGPSPPCHPSCASLECGRNSLPSAFKS